MSTESVRKWRQSARSTTFLALHSWPAEATGISTSLLQDLDPSSGSTTNQVTLSKTSQPSESQHFVYKLVVLICTVRIFQCWCIYKIVSGEVNAEPKRLHGTRTWDLCTLSISVKSSVWAKAYHLPSLGSNLFDRIMKRVIQVSFGPHLALIAYDHQFLPRPSSLFTPRRCEQPSKEEIGQVPWRPVSASRRKVQGQVRFIGIPHCADSGVR